MAASMMGGDRLAPGGAMLARRALARSRVARIATISLTMQLDLIDVHGCAVRSGTLSSFSRF
jgi:hypothetical protein